MKLKVNGKLYDLEGVRTVAQILEHFEIRQPSGIAVALNLSVVKKSEFEKQEIKDGDEIEIIRAVQGG
jgi:sulfur carrier protein